ncbi:MAG TPA: TonB family protein [Terracidiphilus sp.]|nr:TonB family protein [Terracidiphilus sp.]HUX28862.1 TonB family protein [Terracidiphilus sp.]
MSSLLEGAEHLERELTPEPIAAPAMGSLVLHGAILGALLSYGILSGLFHHNFWGTESAGGAMQVNLVSNSIPLPSNQPLNQNVLTTETPSEAPAVPSPKEQKAVDETAIPIQGKQVKPKKQTTQKTQQHQPPPKQENLARYGEQTGTSIPRSMQTQTASNGPVSISNGDFGSRFPWYVKIIKDKVSQNWYRPEVDPRTPKGATATIYFRVNAQGVPSGFSVNTASGSPTLDRSCLLATQRVDTFGPLPSGANVRYLDVTYDCIY